MAGIGVRYAIGRLMVVVAWGLIAAVAIGLLAAALGSEEAMWIMGLGLLYLGIPLIVLLVVLFKVGRALMRPVPEPEPAAADARPRQRGTGMIVAGLALCVLSGAALVNKVTGTHAALGGEAMPWGEKLLMGTVFNPLFLLGAVMAAFGFSARLRQR